MIRTFALLSLLAVLGFSTAADKTARNGVVDAIPLVEADKKLEVKPGKWNEPTVFATETELKKLVADEATRKRLMKEVDFKSHILLVFSWEGSGGDKLEYAILESFPEQVRFTLKSGTQTDCQGHLELFAVKKEARWSAK